MRSLFCSCLAILLASFAFAQANAPQAAPLAEEVVEDVVKEVASAEPVSGDALSVYVIPVKDQIGKPTLYAIRSGVKAALAMEADLVLLDMNTPGGELGSTLEIMEVLDRFPGKTATFVNSEATSAGAIIAAVTDNIYFAPRGVMGSAEPVTGGGEDINESMKRKVLSYMTAKIRAYTEDYRYRADVLQAMADPDTELIIDDQVIKEKGALLNLTATEAHVKYGNPPQPLLGSGIYEDVESILSQLAGDGELTRTDFEITWSLQLASYLMYLNPILIGIAGWLLFAEFQTQGFGLYFGIAVALIAVVFFGHNVAGLSGYEGLLVFIIGGILVLIEIFFFPGALFLAVPGFLMMIGSLLWGMADIWPENTPNYQITPDLFTRPLANLLGGGVIAVILGFSFIRFMPRSVVMDRLVLNRSIDTDSVAEAAASTRAHPEIGDEAIVVSDLYPEGEIEFAGERFEARSELGAILKGARVRVTGKTSFSLIVEEVPA